MARIKRKPQMMAATIASASDTSMPVWAACTARRMLTAASSAWVLFSVTILARMSRPR
ncbi:hypothetical protein D3C72_1876680 [compost metagenome]